MGKYTEVVSNYGKEPSHEEIERTIEDYNDDGFQVKDMKYQAVKTAGDRVLHNVILIFEKPAQVMH